MSAPQTTGTALRRRARRGGLVAASLAAVSGLAVLAPAGVEGVAPPEATISLVAGSGVPGYLGDGGPATLAQLDGPTGVAVDAARNILVVDASNRVRRIGRDGTITTVAGSGIAGFRGDGGPATDAQLHDPIGVAVDAAGGVLIADTGNHRIRRVDPEGTISTVAGNGVAEFAGDGGKATAAELKAPDGVAVDADGGILIADTGNNRIRKVDGAGTITTVAGSSLVGGFAGDGGAATAARLNHPTGVAVARSGDLFIADELNHRIRRVGPHGRISTFAGTGVPASFGDGGPAADAGLLFPIEVLVDHSQRVLIAESGGVRSVERDGTIATAAGAGGPPPTEGSSATSVFLGATGMAFDGGGHLLVADEVHHQVWRLTANPGARSLARDARRRPAGHQARAARRSEGGTS